MITTQNCLSTFIIQKAQYFKSTDINKSTKIKCLLFILKYIINNSISVIILIYNVLKV